MGRVKTFNTALRVFDIFGFMMAVIITNTLLAPQLGSLLPGTAWRVFSYAVGLSICSFLIVEILPKIAAEAMRKYDRTEKFKSDWHPEND